MTAGAHKKKANPRFLFSNIRLVKSGENLEAERISMTERYRPSK